MIPVTKSSKTVKNRKNLGTVDLSRFEKSVEMIKLNVKT